jgi:hypothetical protein
VKCTHVHAAAAGFALCFSEVHKLGLTTLLQNQTTSAVPGSHRDPGPLSSICSRISRVQNTILIADDCIEVEEGKGKGKRSASLRFYHSGNNKVWYRHGREVSHQALPFLILPQAQKMSISALPIRSLDAIAYQPHTMVPQPISTPNCNCTSKVLIRSINIPQSISEGFALR